MILRTLLTGRVFRLSSRYLEDMGAVDLCLEITKELQCARSVISICLHLKPTLCPVHVFWQHAGVPIEPPVQTALVDATCDLPGVLCAGVPGAGGVDAVFAITVHPDSQGGVRELWARWRVGSGDVAAANGAPVDAPEKGGGEGFVCPLLLAASEGGLQGGMLCTRQMPWE